MREPDLKRVYQFDPRNHAVGATQVVIRTSIDKYLSPGLKVRLVKVEAAQDASEAKWRGHGALFFKVVSSSRRLLQPLKRLPLESHVRNIPPYGVEGVI